MKSAENTSASVLTVPSGVGSAVGLDKSHWYVAFVKNNTEKSSSEKLAKAGYENYVPIQTECKIWKNGRKAVVDRVVIPAIVFIHCTDKERKNIVALPYIFKFMVNRAGTPYHTSSKPLAIIPDSQIEKLRFMVGNSDTPVTFEAQNFRKGERVRVIRGSLIGLEGEVSYVNGDQSELSVSIDFLGCAKLTIKSIDLERIRLTNKA